MRSAALPPGMAVSARTWPAAVTLSLGAGLIPETIATFNSPPLLLLTQPAVFLFISAFYGSVALLVREFLRRRPARWAAVLLLGMAAGAANEGIIAGTWYKAPYRGYALSGGFDPALATGLTVFHALVSTVLPILLVECAYPRAASQRWLRRPAITGCLLLLALTTAAGFSAAADRPQKACVLAGVLAAVMIALRLPGPAADRRAARPSGGAADGPARAGDRLASAGDCAADDARRLPSAARLRLAGAAATAGFFTIFSVVPGVIAGLVRPAGLGPWQLLLMALMTAYFSLIIAIGRRWCTRPDWSRRHTLAVITGVLLPAIAASLVLPAALHGLEPLVTLPSLAILIWLSRTRGRVPQLTAPR